MAAKSSIEIKRPKLPPGISYHSTPQGMRYRIRTSSKKLLAKWKASKIDELFETLTAAEKRLYELKFTYPTPEHWSRLAAQLSQPTVRQLLEKHYTEYYSKLKSSKSHKSRMNVICNMQINKNTKELILLGQDLSYKEMTKAQTLSFGDDVRISELKEFLNNFIESRKRQGIKNQTILNDLNYISTAARQAHNYFLNTEKIENPLELVDFKKLKPEVKYIDKRIKDNVAERIKQIILAHSRKAHYYNFFVFLAETGLRISEGLSIEVKDIDFEKGTIFLISKKNEKPRWIGITPSLYPIVKEQAAEKEPRTALFPYSKNTYQTKLRGIKKVLKEEGINFSWHYLRHTFISKSMTEKPISTVMNAIDITDFAHFNRRYLEPKMSEDAAIKMASQQSLTPQETQKIVGHSGLAITVETYTHEDKETELERLQRENEDLKKALKSLLVKE